MTPEEYAYLFEVCSKHEILVITHSGKLKTLKCRFTVLTQVDVGTLERGNMTGLRWFYFPALAEQYIPHLKLSIESKKFILVTWTSNDCVFHNHSKKKAFFSEGLKI